MASDEPGTKRKRSEIDEASRTYERPADFWLEDGNVVLQVQQTQFRLHRSTLRSNSRFFDRLFSQPIPPNMRTLEGCLLLNPKGDSVQDWTNILALIYKPLKALESFPLPYLASMIRLGKRYQFDSIRDKALKVLNLHIPTDFEDWDSNWSPLSPSNWRWKFNWICDQEFDLIKFAEEVGIKSFLPVLYYVCAVNMEADCVFEGTKRKDGTTSRLSTASQRIIVCGQSKILHFMISQTMAWILEKKTPHQVCVTPSKCSTQRVDLMRTLVPKLVVELRYVLDEVTDFTKLRFCAPCLAHVQKMHQEARSKFWKELPSMFGLPDWEDLAD